MLMGLCMKLFKKSRDKTGIQILVTNRAGNTSVMNVHEVGNGPFIYSWHSSNPKYLKPHGEFEGVHNDTLGGCELSWRPHKGDSSKLKFKWDEIIILTRPVMP